MPQVCPVSVLSNWEAQLEEHTRGLQACVYHGPARNHLSAPQLAKHDVVITTYGIVVSDVRKLKRVRPCGPGHMSRPARLAHRRCRGMPPVTCERVALSMSAARAVCTRSLSICPLIRVFVPCAGWRGSCPCVSVELPCPAS